MHVRNLRESNQRGNHEKHGNDVGGAEPWSRLRNLRKMEVPFGGPALWIGLRVATLASTAAPTALLQRLATFSPVGSAHSSGTDQRCARLLEYRARNLD